MNAIVQRWATVAVAVCLVIGAAGFVRFQLLEHPNEPLDRLLSAVTGTMLKFQFEITGFDQTLGLLASRKAGSQGAAEVQLNDPSSSQDVSPDRTQESPATPADELELPGAEDEVSQVTEQQPVPEPQVNAADHKLAFIYHSHNRESWLPELIGTGKDKPNEAFDADINITMLGERLQQKLEDAGVGAIHSDTDYNTAVPSFNYNYSYKYSSKTVKEALAVNRDIEYIFDIHRDSQRRESTTVTINGKDYARLFFIIGQANPNWEQNEAFAKRIHEAMETKLPGVSKGILTKGTKHGHGEYNQSLSPNSVLIELGGVDNTLEENYRTIDALASVIAELVTDARKAGSDL